MWPDKYAEMNVTNIDSNGFHFFSLGFAFGVFYVNIWFAYYERRFKLSLVVVWVADWFFLFLGQTLIVDLILIQNSLEGCLQEEYKLYILR